MCVSISYLLSQGSRSLVEWKQGILKKLQESHISWRSKIFFSRETRKKQKFLKEGLMKEEPTQFPLGLNEDQWALRIPPGIHIDSLLGRTFLKTYIILITEPSFIILTIILWVEHIVVHYNGIVAHFKASCYKNNNFDGESDLITETK